MSTTLVPISPDTKLRLVNSLEDCNDMMRWLGERRPTNLIGLDIETGAPNGAHLNPRAPGARVRLIQVGDGEAGWAVPAHGWGGAAMELLNKWDGRIALHNAAFDTQWLRIHYGWNVPWSRLVDTMLCAKIMRPGKPAQLKQLACELVDPYADSGQTALAAAFKNNGWDWNSIPLDHPAMWTYSALDPVVTALLYEQLPADKVYPEAYELESEVLRITSEMTFNGARIDRAYSEQMREEFLNKAQQGEEWALANWGVNIASNPQMVKLFTDLGAKFDYVTDSGAPSIKQEQLETFENSSNESVRTVARFIQKVKRYRKFSKAYFSNITTLADEDDLLHPSINTIEAITSRMSVSSPALQQLPSGDPVVRRAFLPRKDGEVLLSSDYDQIECRLLASVTQDTGLLAAFRQADADGSDFFSNLGKTIYNDPNFGKKDPRRQMVKTVVYASLYGAAVKRMAEQAKVPLDEFTPVAESVFRSFPGIKGFQRETIEEAKIRARETGEPPCIFLPDGRKIPTESGKEYKLANYRIQGSAAILLKKALIRLDSAELTPYLLLPVHDEVLLSVPREEEKEVRCLVSEIMTDQDSYVLPLTASCEGPFENWGSKYE